MATQLMVLATEGGQPVEHRLLGRIRSHLSHGLLCLFLRYSTLNWAKRGRKVCVCECSKELRDFNEDIKSLLLSLYNF